MKDLLDLLTEDEWRGLQRYFAAVTGITSVTFNLKGEPLFKPEFMNDFCPIVKSTAIGQIACQESHRKITASALDERAAVVDRCHAGFVKVVLPIIIDGQPVGVTGGCGVTLEGEPLPLETVRQTAMMIHYDPDDLLEKLKSIKAITNETLALEIQMLQRMIDEKITIKKSFA